MGEGDEGEGEGEGEGEEIDRMRDRKTDRQSAEWEKNRLIFE